MTEKPSPLREQAIRKAMEDSLPALRAFARGLCLDRMSADDLVQAACERALERLEQVTDIGGVKSWLNRIVYTQWHDMLRRRNRRSSKILQFALHWAGYEESQRSEGERVRAMRLDVEKALASLDPEPRAAVVLVGMLGYSYKEAAAVLELSAGTVASRVARARNRMAEVLTVDERQEQRLKEVRRRSVHEKTG
ncbi:RNA polymerase sigma factor [Desulfopila aestuarii]|nr:RNA polymerase sigma factor [Desulfopila aestuarii]